MSKAKDIPFVRTLYRGSVGADVLAVKRALTKAGYGGGLVMDARFGRALDARLADFQRHIELDAEGVYGRGTHHALQPYFDGVDRVLMECARAAVALGVREAGPLPGEADHL